MHSANQLRRDRHVRLVGVAEIPEVSNQHTSPNAGDHTLITPLKHRKESEPICAGALPLLYPSCDRYNKRQGRFKKKQLV